MEEKEKIDEQNKEEIKEEVGEEKKEPENNKKENKKDEASEEIREAEKKCSELNDKYLRVLAEYDNFRKRSLKERDAIYHDAYADAVKQLLPIIDNIERATSFSNSEEVTKGLSLIVSSINDTLKKMGVAEIETKNFDPNLHNAVMHIEDEKYTEGEIVEVFQKGYKIGDKIIRHAMVKVAN